MNETPDIAGRFAGCLLGGAIGDALGVPVEGFSLDQIRAEFGPDGITDFEEAYGRRGAISDDTQMSLFTAEGMIRAITKFRLMSNADPAETVHRAYLRWLYAIGVESEHPYYRKIVERDTQPDTPPNGWLLDEVKELRQRRGPGRTTLAALGGDRMGTLDEPLNDSKGCGTVMRIAPLGLVASEPFYLGMKVSVTTHGHPSGYLAGGFQADTVSGLRRGLGLREAVNASLDKLADYDDSEEVREKVEQALELAEEATAVPDTIEELGEGWVAEEALSIALFCALTAEDFESGVLAAVNHGGDTDSTGAITGNLLGTLWGVEALPEKWTTGVELAEVLREMAEDLRSYAFEFEPEYSLESEQPEIPEEWSELPERYPPG